MAHDAGQGDHSEGPAGDDESAGDPYTQAAGGYEGAPGQGEPYDPATGYPGEAYPEDAYPEDAYPDATYAGQAYEGGAYDPTGAYPVTGYEIGAGGYPAGYGPGEAYRQQAYEAYQDDYEAPEGNGWQEGPEYGYPSYEPLPETRRTGNGPWPELVMVTAVAVVIAAVALAVTTANRDRSLTSSPPATTGHPLPTSTTSRPTTTTTAPAATSTTRPPATTAPPASAHAVNLTAGNSVKAALVKSWLASDPGGVGLVAKDVAGTAKGQVYYASQPRLGTYWALAAFKPAQRVTQESATAAGQAALSQFQDNVYVFSSHDSSTWTVLGVVSTGACPGDWVPRTVLAVWGLCGLHPSAT
jgi:hypothetical protein